MRVSSVFYPFLKDGIYGPIGRAIDILAILNAARVAMVRGELSDFDEAGE